MSKEIILHLDNLRVTRDQPILRGIAWTVRTAENWVILGANGCGKTSLLSALTGYLTPTAGSVTVLDATYGATDWRELRKKIGFVSNALTRCIEPYETALEVVASGRAAMLNTWTVPTGREAAAARRLLRHWHCGSLANRSWGVLSQGERQRVLIARALAADPALLLLDEPCAGLDPVARENMLGLIEKQATREGGPGIVLITHHVEEITPAFTHAMLMKRGKVVEAGDIRRTLTSQTLTDTFDTPVTISRRAGGWRLTLGANR